MFSSPRASPWSKCTVCWRVASEKAPYHLMRGNIAVQAFSIHCVAEYRFIELGLDIITEARNLLYRYPLRAYDAVQLASALAANQALLGQELDPLTFVSADDRLLKVAADEKLATDNPHLHP